MVINLDRTGTAGGIQHFLKEMEENKKISGILILACEGNDFTPQLIDCHLKKCSKPIFGGIFSRIMFGKEDLLKGTILIGFCAPVETAIIENISDKNNLDLSLDNAFITQSPENKTMFVFTDGINPNVSRLINSIQDFFGLLPNYIGGGAGSLTGENPCIITKKGLLKNAAVLALVDLKSGIGVAHGWQPIAGPLKVSESLGNTIISLNWEPAFHVYRETIEELTGKPFDTLNFSQIAREYPFGIIKMAKEMVVRDPIRLDDQKLVCVGKIPVNSFVYILKGDKDSLISGAVKARKFAEDSYWGEVDNRIEKPSATFFIDCVSRVLFLGDDFKHELAAVNAGYPLFGALTLGEIANTGRNYLEFYNKTSVVGLLGG